MKAQIENDLDVAHLKNTLQEFTIEKITQQNQ
jgi:hypothetical protein